MVVGQIVEVDLTSKEVATSDISEQLVMQYLGGRGFADWLLCQRMDQNVDPTGPENTLVLSNGLLAGTVAPGASRLHLAARSPQTGLLGFANIGGNFGAALRVSGIQCLVIHGMAKKPIYLWIDNGNVEFCDAGFLWGCDTWETENRLTEHLDRKDIAVITIGPAGENLVPFASIMHGHHNAAARTGMGAVMGSKKLKAIVVRRRKTAKSDDSNSASINFAKEYIRQIKDSPRFKRYSTYGVPQSLVACNDMGVLCTQNYRIARSKESEKLSGEALYEHVTRSVSCYRCPVHCKGEAHITEGPYSGYEGSRPEFETLLCLGVKCGLNDPEAVIYLNGLCNRLGIDTASTGSVIAFAMDLYDQKIITRKDSGGLDLTWGNYKTMHVLIQQIARREGLGEILSRGVRGAAQKIGKGSERYAFHVKGLEMPAFDPRGLKGLGFGFAMASRGADFNNTYTLPESRWSPERAETELGVHEASDRLTLAGKDVLLKRCMVVCSVIDCLGICKIPALSIIGDFNLQNEATLAAGISGLPLYVDSLFEVGERVLQIERLINLRFGVTTEDDQLPDFFREKPADEKLGKEISQADMIAAKKKFYRLMGWNSKGIPTGQTLERFGINFSNWD